MNAYHFTARLYSGKDFRSLETSVYAATESYNKTSMYSKNAKRIDEIQFKEDGTLSFVLYSTAELTRVPSRALRVFSSEMAKAHPEEVIAGHMIDYFCSEESTNTHMQQELAGRSKQDLMNEFSILPTDEKLNVIYGMLLEVIQGK